MSFLRSRIQFVSFFGVRLGGDNPRSIRNANRTRLNHETKPVSLSHVVRRTQFRHKKPHKKIRKGKFHRGVLLCVPVDVKIISLTELMAGVKATPKTVQLFQLTCWPDGHKVPTSTNALVELMNIVERWRQRTDYGPVLVISA